jgi:hypothetical protein
VKARRSCFSYESSLYLCGLALAVISVLLLDGEIVLASTAAEGLKLKVLTGKTAAVISCDVSFIRQPF